VTHDSLDLQHQVPVQHSVHLRIPNVHCQGRRKPRVANLGPSTKTSYAGLWTTSIPSGQSIYIGRGLLNLNTYVGSYYLSTKASPGRPIRKTILHPSAGTSRSSSLGEAPDWDSTEDYPEIRGSAYWNPTTEARRINMVGPARGNF
jgi:hypothetical protein